MMMNGERGRERERERIYYTARKTELLLTLNMHFEKTLEIIISNLLHHHTSVGGFPPFMKNL
jgi:hypothetical protein